MRRTTFATIALVLVSCGRRTEVGSTTTETAPSSSSSAPASTSASVATTTSAVAATSARTASSPSPAERAAFAAKLREGREATRSQHYDVAIAAFTRALEILPEDNRALAERGYARYLSKDLVGAKTDFERALAASDHKDAQLDAQIEFNLASTAKAQGDNQLAEVHFQRARELRESPKNCPVTISNDCSGPDGSGTINVFASKAAAIAQLGGKESSFTSTDEFSVKLGQTGALVERSEHPHALLPLDGGRFVAVEAGFMSCGRCGCTGAVEVDRKDGLFKVVYQGHIANQILDCDCDGTQCRPSGDEDGALVFAQRPICKCSEPSCMPSCNGSETEKGPHFEMYVDAKNGACAGSFAVEPKSFSRVELRVDPVSHQLSAKGAGCP